MFGQPPQNRVTYARRRLAEFLFLGDTPIATRLKTELPDLAERRKASLQLACVAAKATEDLKGKATVLLDMTPVTPIVDYFVVTTANSGRQMRAIAEEVEALMKARGSRPRVGVEGPKSETWILQDYGDIVLHVFSPDGRELYDLEHLWADAPHLEWKTLLEAAEAPK